VSFAIFGEELFGVRLRFFAFTTSTIWQGYGPDQFAIIFDHFWLPNDGLAPIYPDGVALVAQQ
jgi:hypothetical protein